MQRRIDALTVTPIAFGDPPLLNASGVHEPLALRTILQVRVGDVVGVGECNGGAAVLKGLRAVASQMVGMSVFELNALRRIVEATLVGSASVPRYAMEAVASIVEVAMHDALGKIVGAPVVELLGGPVREEVPFAAYLFYKWGAHHDPQRELSEDEWGAALDPEGIVRQARAMVERFGFGSFKLKGGVFPPDEEIAAIHALAEAFPGAPLRIDPNTAWTVPTAIAAAERLEGVLEYLEDPTAGRRGMAEVARSTRTPLATNMCLNYFDEFPEAVQLDSVQVLLADHHLWGGLRRSLELARLCRTWGLGLSMHSNSHLGISLAAMTHLAAAVPDLRYACDTHYPWNAEHDILIEAPTIAAGAVRVSDSPGLGVEIDDDRLAQAHDRFLESGRTVRDDTSYMRRVNPAYDPTLPRF